MTNNIDMRKEYYKLKLKAERVNNQIKELIITALQANNGRITFIKTHEDDDYPLTMFLPGRNNIYFISVTDVYLNNGGLIHVDGVDDDTSCVKTGFKIEEESYSDIFYFIGYTLNWFDSIIEQSVKDETNSIIMEMSCQLAEKEMVDTKGKLPEQFMNKNGEYTDYYQDMFNPLYDKYYDKLAKLADFELREE